MSGAWPLALAAALAAASPPGQRPVLVTGEVVALDAQTIIVPQSNSSPVVLRTYVPDGAAVQAGDVVLSIDPGSDGAQAATLETQVEQAAARAARESADLDLKAIEAEQLLLDAELAHAKAAIDAAIPARYLAPLDYDRYQGEAERARRDVEQKRRALEAAREAARRRRDDGALEVKKLTLGLVFASARVAASEVRADRDGIVVHGFSEQRGRRFEQGESAWPGQSAGQVIGAGSRLGVRAYALEADRAHLAEGDAITAAFDALPGQALAGRITRIAGAPELRAAWGDGRYFRVDVELERPEALPLKPGMGVRIEPRSDASVASAPAGAPAPLEGELVSTRVVPIMPPAVRDIWSYNLAQLAPEGTTAKPGMPVAVFESSEIPNKLGEKQGALKEKQSQRAKLELDHAEAARAADVAVAEAASLAEKAARKASQPAELVRRVDYDKLVAERDSRAAGAKLAERKRDAGAAARRAERALLDAEIAQLEQEVEEYTRATAALQVGSGSEGVVIHRTQFNGDKFAVGSQVWIGLSVAEVADPSSLVVQALVPEAQAQQVVPGQRARVTVNGANRVLDARVIELGRVFRTKSRTQPVTVLDVRLALDSPPTGLKPGTAVQVALGTPEPAAVAGASR